jgi:uncharacterized membrane protein
MLPLALSSYTTDWLNLLARWLHVIAVIAWIGSSFYFIALDLHLRPPANEGDAERGVAGEAWEIHGGGFYRVEKFRVAPPALPQPLYWFKWEAYTTWLSGFALMIILYYAHAHAYLIDESVADLSTWEAVVISVGILAGSWLVYDGLCRVLRSEAALAILLLAFTTGLAYACGRLFSARAAWIEVGAALGTMMAANVFFVIIPAHKELVRAKEAGRDPDPEWNRRGKQRSVHNNYLTLPVLLTMLSNHFPSVYGHSHAWLVLVGLMVIAAGIRHFFNLHHQGRDVWLILASAAAGIALIAVLIRPSSGPSAPVTPTAVANGKRLFLSAGCASCHTLADAGAKGKVGPNLDGAKPSRALVVDRVTNGQGVMPPFKDRLSKTQIEAVADYVASVARQ